METAINVNLLRPANCSPALFPLINPNLIRGITVYTIPFAEPSRRKGKCLNRRTGQDGHLFLDKRGRKGIWYLRLYLDTPEGRKRTAIRLGELRPNEAKRKAREWIEREGINSTARYFQATASTIRFDKQAEKYMTEQTSEFRRGGAIAASTEKLWRGALNNHVNPLLGALPVGDISNRVLKDLVSDLVAKKLSAQTVVTYVGVVKSIVASCVNEDGEQIFPRKWNLDFIGLPLVDKANQKRPTCSREQIELLLAQTRGPVQLLFAVLAGSGLRIAEAVALRVGDVHPDGKTLTVKTQIKFGNHVDLKTVNARREVDMPEELAGVLRRHIESKPPEAYLFATSTGTAWQQRNVSRSLVNVLGVGVGCHAFRRMRTEQLRAAQVPEPLIRYWLGHTQESVTDRYAQGLLKQRHYRLDWVEKAGLGFSVAHFKAIMGNEK